MKKGRNSSLTLKEAGVAGRGGKGLADSRDTSLPGLICHSLLGG